MFRSCRNRFRCFSQMKITKPELFRLALKIILVGTGNVLSPHEYFQFDQTLKYVVVNSESAFWDIFGKVPFGIFSQKVSRRDGWMRTTLGGPHKGCGRPRSGLHLGAPLAHLLSHFALGKCFLHEQVLVFLKCPS